MKYYLLEIDEVGVVVTYGPYDSSAERDASARRLHAMVPEDSNTLFVRICGEVIGRLEADGYSDMDLL